MNEKSSKSEKRYVREREREREREIQNDAAILYSLCFSLEEFLLSDTPKSIETKSNR